MLGMFRKKKPVTERPRPGISQEMELQPRSVRDAIDRAAQEKPYVHQQVTGREIAQNILEALKDDRGVHVDTAFGVLGSLAGFACTYPIYLEHELRGNAVSPNLFGYETTTGGRRLYSGALITKNLYETEMSLWSLASGMALELGATNLPDIAELAEHTAAHAGKDGDIRPRVPKDHMPRDLPVNFVRHLFPSYLPLLNRYDGDPSKYFISLGFAVQHLMDVAKDVVEPELSLKIVMECAAPSAQINPAEVV